MTTRTPTLEESRAELAQLWTNWETLRRVTTQRYPVGQTPHEVVWTLNKARLIRYLPTHPARRKHRTPFLLVFALMSRAYILDLRPGASFVEYMANHGYDVYVLDWGAPGPEDQALKFDDYVLDYLPRAIRRMKEISGEEEFSMLGWCIGAILATCYAALRPNDGLRNLVLLTAPLDFSNQDMGGFAKWVREEYLDVESVISAFGNMPPEMLDSGAKWLKPIENYVSNYVRLLDNLDNPKVVDSWHAMDTWVNDPIPMTGGVFRQLVTDFFRGNKLVRGTLTMRGEHVNLANVRANLLNFIAEADHITPPCESENTLPLFGSQDKELERIKGGHIGLMLSSTANKITWPRIETWLRERSD
jgi:polyhydroxyalkanoate synthase